MNKQWIKISLSRFQPNRELLRNVAVYLPKNQRYIRIAGTGDEISDSLLKGLQAKGFADLFVSQLDGEEAVDPADCVLYQENTHALGQADNDVTAVPSTGDKIEPEQELVARNSDTQQAETTFSADTATQESAVTVKSETATPETETALHAPIEEDLESETHIHADSPEKVHKTHIKGSSEKEVEPEMRFSADAKSEETTYIVKGLSSQPEAPSITRIGQTLEKVKESMLLNQSVDIGEQKDGFLRDAKNSLIAGKVSEQIIDLARRVSSLETSEEKTKLESVLNELESVLSKASSGMENTEQYEKRFSIKNDMEEIETIFTDDPLEEEKILKISDQMTEVEEKREEALRALEESRIDPLLKSSSDRNLPQQASKFASYLAHSLGYSDLNYLTDIATLAAIRLSEEQLPANAKTKLPPLASQVMDQVESLDPVLQDTKEVISVLEKYFTHPDCDRTQKEITSRTFKIVLEEMQDTEAAPSFWNITCWEQYLENGLGFEAHSLCSKASANAIRLIKSLN